MISDETPIPGLVPAFEMLMELGVPVEIGALAIGGRRVHVPVKGGIVTGEDLTGALVGGAEMLLERADGVTVVEASYYVRSADGAAVRLFGQGYRTAGGTRLGLLAEAAAGGPLARLASVAFVAEALPGEARLAVMRIS
jgi:hypothetical protein